MKGSPVRVRASALLSCLHSVAFGAARVVRVVYARPGYVPKACTQLRSGQAPGPRPANPRRAAERPRLLCPAPARAGLVRQVPDGNRPANPGETRTRVDAPRPPAGRVLQPVV